MRNATILIVEDDAILAMNLRRMIALMGYTVAGSVATGEKALALLAKNSVDLVLMDIELAGTMDGITTAETIYSTLDIPIVFLTGFSQDPYLKQAKIAAPYGYLVKPVPERELAATLEMALHRHKLDRELVIRNQQLVLLQQELSGEIAQRKQAEEELQKSHNELEQKVLERTADLEKTNATLAMMLDYARKTETDIQERVVSNLRANILGIVDVLKKQQLAKSTQDLVELLETTTLNLAHPIARNLESQLLKLTAREIQLANFIRLGKSTKELVELLNISKKTVGTHRDNLRKKLGLNNKKINLRTFLNSEFAK